MPKRKNLPPPPANPTPTVPQPMAPVSEAIAELRRLDNNGRVDQVMRWLIAGQRDLEIVETIAEAWPDTDQTKLMTAVLKKFTEAATLPPAFVRGWVYEARREILRQFLEIGDLAGARSVLRDIEAAAK